VLSSPEVGRALGYFERNADAITEEQIRICSIPASPFGEQQRAEYLREKFSALGLTEVEIDDEGNCLGLLEGRRRSPLLVVSAHLDTVFSPETDFTVTRSGERLLAPGIAAPRMARLKSGVLTGDGQRATGDGECRKILWELRNSPSPVARRPSPVPQAPPSAAIPSSSRSCRR